jgi:hypothetical protein
MEFDADFRFILINERAVERIGYLNTGRKGSTND